MEDRLDVIVAACRAKLTQNRLREREVKQAQDEFERAQRERTLAEQEQAQADHRQHMARGNRVMLRATLSAMEGGGPGQAGKHVTDLHKIPKDLRNLANGDIKSVLLRRAGLSNYNMAYQAVVHERLPTPNAHSVSGQLVKFGTRFVLGANAAAEQDLRDALAKFDGSFGNSDGSTYSSPYSSTNPRPFATQIDDAIEMSQELETHIDRVADAVLKLPIGDQSVVNTSTGNLLSEIVKARANGDISSLSNALTEYVGSVRDQAIAEYHNDAPETISEAAMREERLAVLAVVDKEVARLAATARPAPPRNNSGGRTQKSTRSACAQYYPAGRNYVTGGSLEGVRNICSHAIQCTDHISGRRFTLPGRQTAADPDPTASFRRPVTCKG